MAEADTQRFAYPEEVEVPAACEGWEEMYPDSWQFGLAGREASEKESFWFQDKVHCLSAIPPWGVSLQEGWRFALPEKQSRVFAIPPSMGVRARIINGYIYMNTVHTHDKELMGEREALFKERSQYYFQHFEELYDEEWYPRQRELGEAIQALEVPDELPKYTADEALGELGESPTADLIEAYHTLIDKIFRAYQLHFEFNNLAYVAYMTFTDFCKEAFPGITDDVIGKMVSAVETDLFRGEEELSRLAKQAAEDEAVAEILKRDDSVEAKREALAELPAGRDWLERYEDAKDPWFYMSCGAGWHHDEGSWLSNPEVPFDSIRTKLERLEAGETIERDFEGLKAEKEALVEEYLGYLDTEEDKQAFKQLHGTCEMIYQYPENHHFWLVMWKHTIAFRKMREFGELLTTHDFLDDPDDVFMFTRFEVDELLEDLGVAWAIGPEMMGTESMAEKWKGLAAERREIYEAAKEWSPPPAIGQAPDEIQDAITVMMWGITTETVDEWLGRGEAGEDDHLRGTPASQGVVEGPARVTSDVGEINTLEEGEILVCESTDPSWAPAFTKIGGAVTDIGGIASHAAIVCREYGLPAVTGTGTGTQEIETGDRVRIDGETGEVEVIERGAD